MPLSTLTAPPNIATNKDGWDEWGDNRRQAIRDACPSERALTHYYSITGSDANDGLTPATAKQNWQTAVTWLNAIGGRRVLLKRGDMWRVSVNGLLTTNSSVGAYGDGDDPFINHYTIEYLASADLWTLAAGNRYTITGVTQDIDDLRYQDDRPGPGYTVMLAKKASSALCEGESNSFFYDSAGDVLHVNLGGANPNDHDLEAVETNFHHGVGLSVHGSRCEGIRFDGHGNQLAAAAATQCQGITSLTTGLDCCYFLDCTVYGGNTHTMAHWNNSQGGIVLFERCKGGLPYSAATVASNTFNMFAPDGGQECWLHDCESEYGSRKGPIDNYATEKVVGTGIGYHTTSGDLGMIVVTNFTVRDGDGITAVRTLNDGAGNTFTEDALTDCNVFIVGCTHEEFPVAAANKQFTFGNFIVFYGNRFHFRPAATQAQLCSDPAAQVYLINNEFDFNMADKGNNNFSFIDGASAVEVDIHMFHNTIKIREWTTTNGTTRFRISGDQGTGTAAPGTVCENSRFINNIYAFNGAVSTARLLGLNNISDATRFSNNAFWRTVAGTDSTGISNDAARVTLAEEPAFGTSYAGLLAAGSTVYPISHDINGKKRTAATPDIGPVDFSSLVTTGPGTTEDAFLHVQQLNLAA